MTIMSELSDKNNSALVREIARELGEMVVDQQHQGSQVYVSEEDLRSRFQEAGRRLVGNHLRSPGPAEFIWGVPI